MPLELNEDGSLPMWQDEWGRRHPTAAAQAVLNGGTGGPHSHPESEVVNLAADLAAKAETGHTHAGLYEPVHSHPYAAASHAHVDGDLPAGIARDAEVAAAYSPLAHAHAYEPAGTVATHAAAGNPHPTYATDADLAAHAATPHGGGGSLPAGLIVMWGGLVANIPAGWVLCDGQNGTPDLRDRFIKGATGNPGATGGSTTHTHAAHTGVINHTHPITDPGHSHLTQRYPTATGSSTGFTIDTSMSGTLADNTLPTKAATTGVTTSNPAGGVASLTHDSPSSEPPFYALAFIQKT